MSYSRTVTWVFVMLLTTLGGAAWAQGGRGTIEEVAVGGLPDRCVAVRFTSSGGLQLYRRDVCTVIQGGQALGKAVVLLSGDKVAVFHTLFARPIRPGARFQVAERQGFVQEDAFIKRLGSLCESMHTKLEDTLKGAGESKKSGQPWNGLHFWSRTDYTPGLVHFWAANVRGSVVAGVDDTGYWRTLTVANSSIPVVSWNGRSQTLSDLGDGEEIDVVLGKSGSTPRVAAIVVYPPLTVEMLLARTTPRIPESYDRPVPLFDARGTKAMSRGCLRQLRYCRMETLDVLRSRASLRQMLGYPNTGEGSTGTGEGSTPGEFLRVALADPVLDLETCEVFDQSKLMSKKLLDLVCYSRNDMHLVLAVGRPYVLAEAEPKLVARVIGPAGDSREGHYYSVALLHRDGVKPRDIVTLWRKGVRLGEGMLTCRGGVDCGGPICSRRRASTRQGLIYVRPGAPPLVAGDAVTFERRSGRGYVDEQVFEDVPQSDMRRISSPREVIDTDAYVKDKLPRTPDMYHGGPYQTGPPPSRPPGLPAPQVDSESGYLLMGKRIVLGYHLSVGKIRESKLTVHVEQLKGGSSLVHLRLQFHAPFDWGDPEKVLETNVTLDREAFKEFARAWTQAVDAWRYAPEDMRSKGYHGKASDPEAPAERFVEIMSGGREKTKHILLAFTDPRPLFSKRNVNVKRIDAILSEDDVEAVGGILEVTKRTLGW